MDPVLVSAVLVWFVLSGAEQGDIYLIYGDSGPDEFNFKGAVLKQIRQKVPWVGAFWVIFWFFSLCL